MKRLIALFLVSFFISCQSDFDAQHWIDRNFETPDNIFLDEIRSVKFLHYLPKGKAVRLFIGKDSIYEARILFYYNGIYDSLITQDSIFFEFFLDTAAVNSGVKFNIYSVVSDWDEEGVNWYTSGQYTRWYTPGGDIGKLLYTVEEVGDSIRIRLDSTLLKAITNKGIILLAKNDGWNTIWARSGSRPPQIQIYKSNKLNEEIISKDVSISVLLDSTFDSKFIETGLNTALYCSFNDTLEKGSDVVAGFLNIRMSTISSLTDSIGFSVYCVRDTTNFFYPQAYKQYASLMVFSKDSIATLDIKSLLQFWSDNPDSLLGFVISGFPPASSLFLSLIDSIWIDYTYISPPEGRKW